MKSKKVWRYYCEYCKKSGCSKFHIRRHEIGCTKNPNRVCGICAELGVKQREIGDLLSCLPDNRNTRYYVDEDGSDYPQHTSSFMREKLENLREVANNCPACILTAIRLTGNAHEIMADAFNFRDEVDSAFKRAGQNRLRNEMGG